MAINTSQSTTVLEKVNYLFDYLESTFVHDGIRDWQSFIGTF